MPDILKKYPFYAPISKTCICRELDSYLRLNAGLRWIFEASIQSEVCYNQDLNHKKGW